MSFNWYLRIFTKYKGRICISKGIADGFGAILKFAEAGVNFVFGGLANDGQAPFFLTVLLPIIFLAVLIGILQHIKVLPIIIRAVGFY